MKNNPSPLGSDDLGSFSGRPIIRLRKAAWEDDEYILELKLPEHKDWEGIPIGGTLSSKDADERVIWWNNIGREINEALAAREEKIKEAIIKSNHPKGEQ